MHTGSFFLLYNEVMEKMKIEELTETIKHCHKCDLSNNRNKPIIGDGSLNVKIMIVGEGPGATEDQTGIAFSGPAGKLLDKMLKAINLTRQQVYLTNVVKCFPPQNRTPLTSEVNCCLDYLRNQYVLIKPRLIIILGAVASKALIDQKFSLTREHGKPISKKGVIMIPTFHPAALLRDESKKPAAWEDWKTIKKTIDLYKLI
jgi:uracil-DNA glycosylase family 4